LPFKSNWFFLLDPATLEGRIVPSTARQQPTDVVLIDLVSSSDEASSLNKSPQLPASTTGATSLAAEATTSSTTDKDPTKKTIRISYKDSHLSDPGVWKSFFDGYKSSALKVTSLQVGDCYWIEAKLVTDAIIKLVNLRVLNIRGTQLSLPDLSKVFGACKKINNLDFSYKEEYLVQVEEAVEDDKAMEVIQNGFKTLDTLKMATSFRDARDYVNDPWNLIIWILRYNFISSFFSIVS